MTTEAAQPKQEMSMKQYAERVARHLDRIAYSHGRVRHDVGKVQIDFVVVNNTGRNQRAINFKFAIGPDQITDINMVVDDLKKDPEGYTLGIFEKLKYMIAEAQNNNREFKRRKSSQIILPNQSGQFIV